MGGTTTLKKQLSDAIAKGDRAKLTELLRSCVKGPDAVSLLRGALDRAERSERPTLAEDLRAALHKLEHPLGQLAAAESQLKTGKKSPSKAATSPFATRSRGVAGWLRGLFGKPKGPKPQAAAESYTGPLFDFLDQVGRDFPERVFMHVTCRGVQDGFEYLSRLSFVKVESNGALRCPPAITGYTEELANGSIALLGGMLTPDMIREAIVAADSRGHELEISAYGYLQYVALHLALKGVSATLKKKHSKYMPVRVLPFGDLWCTAFVVEGTVKGVFAIVESRAAAFENATEILSIIEGSGHFEFLVAKGGPADKGFIPSVALECVIEGSKRVKQYHGSKGEPVMLDIEGLERQRPSKVPFPRSLRELQHVAANFSPDASPASPQKQTSDRATGGATHGQVPASQGQGDQRPRAPLPGPTRDDGWRFCVKCRRSDFWVHTSVQQKRWRAGRCPYCEGELIDRATHRKSYGR